MLLFEWFWAFTKRTSYRSSIFHVLWSFLRKYLWKRECISEHTWKKNSNLNQSIMKFRRNWRMIWSLSFNQWFCHNVEIFETFSHSNFTWNHFEASSENVKVFILSLFEDNNSTELIIVIARFLHFDYFLWLLTHWFSWNYEKTRNSLVQLEKKFREIDAKEFRKRRKSGLHNQTQLQWGKTRNLPHLLSLKKYFVKSTF